MKTIIFSLVATSSFLVVLITVNAANAKPLNYLEDLKMVKQYCFDHADKILAGGNPIQDLINASLISSYTFQNLTCKDIDWEITKEQAQDRLEHAFGVK